MIIRNFVSFISGILFGYLIIKYIYPRLQFQGPDSNEIRKDIYFDLSNQTCFQFLPQPYICPLSLLKQK